MLPLILGLIVLVVFSMTPAVVYAFDFHVSHSDPIAPVILGVTGILFVALVGRFSARKIGLPSVLGELILGMLIGNLAWYFHFDLILVLREGPAIFDAVQDLLHGEEMVAATVNAVGEQSAERLRAILQGPNGGELLQVAQTVDVFSRYGIIFLLFLVGLETSIDEMRAAGGESARVAIIGVVAPFALGFIVSRMLIPDMDLQTSLFLGATLAATSVGITAMVLQEMKVQATRTAHIILGAAVFDDVLGLLILAIVSGIVVTGSIDVANIVVIIIASTIFIVGSFYLGPILIEYIVGLIRHFDEVEAKMFVSYMFVMVLAYMANFAGLATIIGAFAAGLILQDAYFKHWNHRKCPFSIKDLIMPLEVVLVPIFFEIMGIQVKL